MGRPDTVVNAAARSGAFFSAGSLVSRSQRALGEVSAAVFIRGIIRALGDVEVGTSLDHRSSAIIPLSLTSSS